MLDLVRVRVRANRGPNPNPNPNPSPSPSPNQVLEMTISARRVLLDLHDMPLRAELSAAMLSRVDAVMVTLTLTLTLTLALFLVLT